MPMHNPAHPGTVLKEYLAGRSLTEFAAQIGSPADYLQSLIDGRVGIRPALSAKLSHYLGTSDGFCLRMQEKRDAWVAEHP
jgi:antitoxin HigA-1